jgi:hypothetical protein
MIQMAIFICHRWGVRVGPGGSPFMDAIGYSRILPVSPIYQLPKTSPRLSRHRLHPRTEANRETKIAHPMGGLVDH